jgi:hypothetical protein
MPPVWDGVKVRIERLNAEDALERAENADKTKAVSQDLTQRKSESTEIRKTLARHCRAERLREIFAWHVLACDIF